MGRRSRQHRNAARCATAMSADRCCRACFAPGWSRAPPRTAHDGCAPDGVPVPELEIVVRRGLRRQIFGQRLPIGSLTLASPDACRGISGSHSASIRSLEYQWSSRPTTRRCSGFHIGRALGSAQRDPPVVSRVNADSTGENYFRAQAIDYCLQIIHAFCQPNDQLRDRRP